MGFINVILVLVVFVGATVAADEQYTGMWNYVDTHMIIDNERLYQRYEQCILGTSSIRCSSDSLELKDVLTHALKEVCAKCSPEQRDKIKDSLSYICKKRPDSFARIFAKVDPEMIYRPIFEAKYGPIEGGC